MFVDTFANQEALDWLTDLAEEDDLYFVHNTLEIIVDYPEHEQPDCWDCICALAAAELVAAARGNPPENLPRLAVLWLDTYKLVPDEELLNFSCKAVERVAANSWLAAEWSEGIECELWQQSLSDLRARLGG